MDRFLLGMLTGVGALIAPILVISLVFSDSDPDGGSDEPSSGTAEATDSQSPKPEPTAGAGDGSEAEQANAESQANWPRRPLGRLGLSVELPETWLELRDSELGTIKVLQPFLRSGAADAIVLVMADSRTEKDMNGLAVFMDNGPLATDPLSHVENLKDLITSQVPLIKVSEAPRRMDLSDLEGASVRLKLSALGGLFAEDQLQSYLAVDAGRRSLLVMTLAKPESDAEEVLARMERSIRRE